MEPKLKNIGILEIHYHIKYLYSTIRILKTKKTNVTIFTTKEIFERLKTYMDDLSNFEFIIKKDDESLSIFIRKIEKICNEKIDLLFINTIQTNTLDVMRYASFKPKSKIIATVHVTNHWLKAKYGFNYKNILRTIDINISLFIIRKNLLKKFNAINVGYPPIKDHVEKNTTYQKPVFKIPFNFYEGTFKKKLIKDGEKIKFVISGLIEDFRRDYDYALDVFEKIFEKYNEKIELFILGQPVGKYGKKIINRCKKLKDKKYNIYFFEKFIPEKKYNEIMMSCDILLSPLKVLKIADTGIKEIYGKTEGSGIPFEGIQYVKPVIIPKDFQMITEMEKSVIQYESKKDLEEKIIGLIKNRDILRKLQNEAEKSSQNFSLSKLNEYFETEILNKIDITD